MAFRRVVLLSVILMITLAGCYRQASDSFEPVDSQNNAGAPQDNQPTPDVEPTVVEVDLTPAEGTAEAAPPEATQETGIQSPIPFDDPEPTATPTLGVTLVDPSAADTEAPTDDLVTATPMVINTVPPAVTVQPDTDAQDAGTDEMPDTAVATATESGVITPDAPSGPVTFPTLTPLPTREDPFTILTPTSLPDEVRSECTYTVRSGDNLYRIAVNNNVNLNELRAVNSITGDLIQPGQVLTLPGCEEGETTTDDTEEAAAPESTEEALPSGTTLHVVQPGETLGTIARRYNVTIAAIAEANNLSDVNVLSVDQELIIPNQP